MIMVVSGVEKIYNGKTLEEALVKAERENGRSRDELLYEIEEHKKGFFKNKDVKIVVKGSKTKGKVGIINGKFKFEEGDMLPQIEPGQNVIVKVNGKIISGKTEVNKSDNIDVEVKNINSERKMHISVSEDNMQTFISIEYIPERKYKLVDKKEDNCIIIESELIEEVYPEKFQRSDVEKILEEKKIKYGVRWEEINNIISGGTYVIANGLKPQKTVDDKIKYYFNIEKHNKPIEIGGKVDYYNIGEVEFVEKGKILAISEEGEDGKPGCDVFGQIIPALPRKRVKIHIGPGCEALDNGRKAIASINGSPSIKGDRICVFPSHTINGDVDIATGNIQFDGDIVIKGNVKEGMKVKAGNNLTIQGSVADSLIISVGDVNISQNVICSEVRAGDREFVDTRAFEYLSIFSEFLNKISIAFMELHESGKLSSKVNIGLVYKMLFQSKFKDIREKLYEGKEFIEKNNPKNEVAEMWKKATGVLSIIEEGGMNSNALMTSVKDVVDNFIYKYNVASTPANVTISYSQNSNIFATNIVEVKGKGCYNTNITAENKVIISGQPGVFRGGQINAKNSIQLREVGSSAGVLTLLKTSKEGIIESSVVYQNTLITVGEQIYKFDNPARNVKAYIAKGELVVEKLKL